MKGAVKKLETRTRRGKTEALCKKCGRWQALDDDHWYRHAGQELPYLGHCKSCERERSRTWHAEHRRSKPKKSTAKKTAAKRAAARKGAARRSTKRKAARKRA